MKPKKNLVFALADAVAVVAAACVPSPAPPARWHQRFLTRDSADVTTITERPKVASKRPRRRRTRRPTPGRCSGGTARLARWTQYSCATVTHSGLPVQEGVALRMRSDGARHRGITVMKNIWAGATSVYNVHLWDTTIGGGLPARHIAGFQMDTAALPIDNDRVARRLCAKVEGAMLRFKVWRADQPEPAWSNPIAARSLRLPTDWVFSGQPGLYIGHLPANGWAVFTDHTTGKLRPQGCRPVQHPQPP